MIIRLSDLRKLISEKLRMAANPGKPFDEPYDEVDDMTRLQLLPAPLCPDETADNGKTVNTKKIRPPSGNPTQKGWLGGR